ncbi:metal ABC transporter ATP-binding protein [Vreelandella jeotgali]|uniref:metal ABC transporter ATP-binding protein n=1 Tax=Vreelandella jeotgali TaxID=553386 RepID=UPI0003468BC9|nr:metal ABC transporter ATP-binding protein [Halomonas jeotgali]
MISIQDLTVSYGNYKALDGITLSTGRGRLVGVIGPNGSGKSTFIKAMMGLIPRDRGDIRLLDKPLKKVRKRIAYVPQHTGVDWDFPINVINTVLLGTYPKLGYFRWPGRKEKAMAAACLEEVGLQEYAKRPIGALSGGQQQRVFLARALAQQADLFLLDEPFVGIDVGSEATIIAVLKRLRDEGKTVLIVHHDLSRAAEYFDDLILLNRKLLAYGTAADVIEPDRLFQAYESQIPFLNAG